MKRILFVDDEQPILDGLRNLLRKQRKDWEMVFALGADAALAACARSPFDVVVSDMRMPGMDGAALLAEVKRLHPMTARIVLSGYADPEAIRRALPVANQFLSKPCDTEALRGVIQRACDLHEHIGDAATRALLGGLERLPSVPQTYFDLSSLLARPETSAAEVASIVERDPAMTIKLLQLSNSAFFGRTQRVSSVQQAVTYLGTELLRALTLSAHVFGIAEQLEVRGFSLERLQERSLSTARLCRAFIGDRERAEEAYTVGLIRDAGCIALAHAAPRRFETVLDRTRDGAEPLHEAERAELGVTHAEAGAYMLGMWGLPLSIVEAVAYHHAPRRCRAADVRLLAALHVADALAERTEDALDVEFLERSGTSARLPEWRALAEQELATAR